MKTRRRKYLFIVTLMLLTGFLITDALAAPLVWQTSRQAAVTLAQQQGKKILLLAGHHQ